MPLTVTAIVTVTGVEESANCRFKPKLDRPMFVSVWPQLFEQIVSATPFVRDAT